MAILVDINQIVIAAYTKARKDHKKIHGNLEGFSERSIMEISYALIKKINKKFRDDYGNIIICCDDKFSWRKKFFPYYKEHRKDDRSKSEIDWNDVFRHINNFISDLEEHFPYIVLKEKGAEADDIIGIMANELSKDEKVLIISRDSDFVQLQTLKNVDQYSLIDDKYIRDPNPKEKLLIHIMKGDWGDGIPNYLSADDARILKIKQPSVTKKRIQIMMDAETQKEGCVDNKGNFDPTIYRQFMRNKILIDLGFTPKQICDNVLTSYYEQKTKPTKRRLFEYFVNKRLDVDELQFF